jgi:hypothetical protein
MTDASQPRHLWITTHAFLGIAISSAKPHVGQTNVAAVTIATA